MELEITTCIYINIDEIIEHILNGTNIDDAIDNYIIGMDDCEYYLIGSEETKKIKEEVKKRLDKMKPKKYNVYRKKKGEKNK